MWEIIHIHGHLRLFSGDIFRTRKYHPATFNSEFGVSQSGNPDYLNFVAVQDLNIILKVKLEVREGDYLIIFISSQQKPWVFFLKAYYGNMGAN